MNEAPMSGSIDRFAEVKGTFENYAERLGIRRIDPNEFRGNPQFPDSEIDQDCLEQQSFERRFKERNARRPADVKKICENGFVVEAIFTEGIVMGNVFGENAVVMIPAKIDDIRNNVDLLVGAGPETNSDRKDGIKRTVFGIGFDFASNADDAVEKLTDTLQTKILDGKTPSVRYGEFPGVGQIRDMQIAKVILGADAEHVEDFADEISNGLRSQPHRSMSEITGEILDRHPVYKIIMDEMLTQLLAFRNIADAFGNEQAAHIYGQAYELVDSLLKEKGIGASELMSARRGDTMAAKLFSMIAKAAIPNKKYQRGDFRAGMAQ